MVENKVIILVGYMSMEFIKTRAPLVLPSVCIDQYV